MLPPMNIIFPHNQNEGTVSVLSEWLKKVGDKVSAHEPIVEIETDKVIVEISAPIDGVLTRVIKQEGDEVVPGEILATIESVNAASSQHVLVSTSNPLSSNTLPFNTGETEFQANTLSPVVRKLLREHQLDPSGIQGTGKNLRITKQDVERFLQLIAMPDDSQQTIDSAGDEPPVISQSSVNKMNSYTIPHSSMRKRIAAHMVDSLLNTSPHVTSVFEVDMSAVLAHRLHHQAEYKKKAVSLTLSAYFIEASVKALQTVPEVNSRFYDDHLEVFTDINIGVSTALAEKGLVVPVLHEAQNHNLFGVAAKLQKMTEKARDGKLIPADMQKGTFTISNHGVSGSLLATPIIINQPQVAILGVGKLEKRVVVEEVDGQDTMVIKPMCYVSLSIDHRALDAYQTNLFLSTLVDVLENWK